MKKQQRKEQRREQRQQVREEQQQRREEEEAAALAEAAREAAVAAAAQCEQVNKSPVPQQQKPINNNMSPSKMTLLKKGEDLPLFTGVSLFTELFLVITELFCKHDVLHTRDYFKMYLLNIWPVKILVVQWRCGTWKLLYTVSYLRQNKCCQ